MHDYDVKRDITADAINVKWQVDIREHWTIMGNYLLQSRNEPRIISWVTPSIPG